tara:strand:+ start:154 stop:516 length:363 start_codon:yes stop_codon:yes gene_type:complete
MKFFDNPSPFLVMLGILIAILVFLIFLFLFFRIKIVQKIMDGIALLGEGFFGTIFMFLFLYPISFIYHAKNVEESSKQEKTGWFDDVGWKQFIILHIPTLVVWIIAWFYILKFLIKKFLF